MWWPKLSAFWRRFDRVGPIILVIAVGVASRLWPIGWRLFDKYLGDALYAALVYLLLSLIWPRGTTIAKVWLTVAVMLLIEAFQLTGLPLQWRLSGNPLLHIVSIVLGTSFSWLDIAAYLVGILTVWALDVYLSTPWEVSAMSDEHLFVYGTLRRGFEHPMADLLARQADYVGLGRFQGYLYDLGSYPGVKIAPHATDIVVGDVYRLSRPRYLLKQFDRYEGYNPRKPAWSPYLRQRVSITMAEGQTLSAWIYLYNRPIHHYKLIEAGDYLAYLRGE